MPKLSKSWGWQVRRTQKVGCEEATEGRMEVLGGGFGIREKGRIDGNEN
jgi:hypothetical protein